MLKTCAWILNRVQQTTRFYCATLVLLTNLTFFTNFQNRLKHILPIKTFLTSCQKFPSAKMPAKGAAMQVMQDDLNSTTQTIRYNRIKVVPNKLTQQFVYKLINTTAISGLLNKFLIPMSSTRLLFIQQLLSKCFYFINRDNTVQKLQLITK